MVPYIAVNELEQTPSRQFGRDSFQNSFHTLSTGLSQQAQGFPSVTL